MSIQERLAEPTSLRPDSEQRLRHNSRSAIEHTESMSLDRMQALIQELRVHKIELEAQNEQLRRTQAQLDASHARYVELYDRAPVGYCTLNEHGLIVESNLTLCHLLGVPRSSLNRIPFSQFIAPEDQNAFFSHHHPLSTSRFSGPDELRLRRGDGITIWVQLVSSTTKGTDDPIRHRIALADITDRKRAEAAENEALGILQKVASRVPGAVYQFRLHSDGRFSMPYASHGLYSLFGISLKEVRDDAAKIFTLSHPDDLSGLVASILESAEAMTPWNHEFRFLVDGTLKWLSGNAAPEREPDGSVLWHGFVNDVTERVQAEAARVSLESQLRESQKMEAIGTLAGGIAHDFNNALAVILGNVELAQNAVTGDDFLKHLLSDIQRAGFRSRNLVKQILSFCRRQPTSLRRISLGKGVQEAVSLLRATMQSRVTLNFKTEDELPAVLADDTQIEQVIVNLVTNAMQAIPHLSGVIEVCVDSVSVGSPELATVAAVHKLWPDSSRRLVRISVSDNGKGMAPSVRERIFEPFFTTKPQGEGTGLGLAVVHGIVSSHGGVIDVESEPGYGTTFRIFLPAAEDSLHTSKKLNKPCTDCLNSQSEFSTSKRSHVLLIDDDEAVLKSTRFTLEHLGYTVSAFSDPDAALEAYRRDPLSFQITVADHNMPSISGLEVVAAMRAIDPNRPAIVMSGFVNDELQTKAAKAGVSALIAKPFTMAELDARVKALLITG